MIAKACLAGALALVPITSQAQLPPPTFVTNPYIERVDCLEGRGSAFKLDTGQWVSVNHVTRLTGCTIDGLPIKVTYADPVGDFSTFELPGDNRRGGLHADCSGYHDKQWVHATGHARGLPILQSLPVMYSRLVQYAGINRGWSVLIYNAVIPGQSGGPVLNQRGEVVGTVNAYNPFYPVSFSRALKDTILCQTH